MIELIRILRLEMQAGFTGADCIFLILVNRYPEKVGKARIEWSSNPHLSRGIPTTLVIVTGILSHWSWLKIGYGVTDVFGYAVTMMWQVYGVTDVFGYAVTMTWQVYGVTDVFGISGSIDDVARRFVNPVHEKLREDTFSGNKNDDAHEHVEKVLDIVSLFSIPGVSYDAIMLGVFPITLIEAAKRWIDRIPLGTINTWDLLEKTFFQRYCLPSKTAKQLEEIHNFKQEGDETLYQAWERRTSSGGSNAIDVITRKLDSLGRHMKKLRENVHAIQVGCGLYGGTHLDKECPLNEEVKGIDEVKYVSKKENEGPSGVLSCQLPLKELNLGSFTLPSTIGSLNMYALADLVEMADMSKKDPMGIVENILVKIDKFIFPSDFMVFYMLGDPNEAMILGTTYRAQGKDKKAE
ncbi:hypothetical protein Tco_1078892 [Tanacetum coccineum]|uniref:Retrotransposon gag domain-containing protein n=1 Tax=Tanacetum coccineum TaxID=301880 RepID=A0ABQ5HQA2_9ASTR